MHEVVGFFFASFLTYIYIYCQDRYSIDHLKNHLKMAKILNVKIGLFGFHCAAEAILPRKTLKGLFVKLYSPGKT